MQYLNNVNTFLNKNHLPGQLCHNFIWLLNYIPISFIENVLLGAKDSFCTKLKKVLGRIFFEKNVVPKESFFFVASDVVSILYIEPCICTGD